MLNITGACNRGLLLMSLSFALVCIPSAVYGEDREGEPADRKASPLAESQTTRKVEPIQGTPVGLEGDEYRRNARPADKPSLPGIRGQIRRALLPPAQSAAQRDKSKGESGPVNPSPDERLRTRVSSPDALGRSASRWEAARNPANPYDVVGLQHNEVVASFAKSRQGQEFKAGLLSHKMQPLTHYFEPFCKNWRPHGPGFPGPYWPTSWPYDPMPLLDFSKTVKAPMDWIAFSQKTPSRTLQRNLQLIVDETKKLPQEKTASPENYSGIINLEAAITADKAIDENDKKSLLMAASVARYSHAYWTGPSNEWAGIPVDWGRVSAVDAIGAIGGPVSAGLCSIADLLFQTQ